LEDAVMSPTSVQVKICGITRPEDAAAAVRAGADAIGLNFVAGPRKIDPDRARLVLKAIPEHVEVWVLADVGNGDLPGPVKEIIPGGRITHVQMYGPIVPETLARMAYYGLSTVAVRHVTDIRFVEEAAAWLVQCRDVSPDLLLLDAAGPLPGGTGRPLNWKMIAEQKRAGRLEGWPPIVLAGGLTPENVAEAVRLVAPFAVDVSSGVEQLPGCKDSAKVEAFIKAVRGL
jgi:phosphoribosylanthranilate isomerase